MGVKIKIKSFLLWIILLCLMGELTGHGHHSHRHHHKNRHVPHHDHLSSLTNQMVQSASMTKIQPSLDKSTAEDNGKYNDDYYEIDHSLGAVGSANHYKNIIKNSRKNYTKIPNGDLLTASSSYRNESGDRESVMYFEELTYHNKDGRKNVTSYKSDTPATKKNEYDNLNPNHPKTLDKEASENNYMSPPQWTLKYQGVPSEQSLNNTKINVTAPAGGSAFLPCKIGHLGDRQISWIRRRDWHVLTSGKTLYTHDQRFSVLHEPSSQEWVLHIKWVDLRDIGSYECQVSMGTGIISLFVNLRVVIPEAYIPGHGQHHVDRGSSISLNCYVKNSPIPPQYILWHHNGKLLNFIRDGETDFIITDNLGNNRNDFDYSLELAAGTHVNGSSLDYASDKVFLSHLQVEIASEFHSGNYTCSAPNTEATSTFVFITEGDKTAAVQRIGSGTSVIQQKIIFVAFFTLGIFLA